MRPLLHLGLTVIRDRTFIMLGSKWYYRWDLWVITLAPTTHGCLALLWYVSKLTRVTCQNHIIQPFRSLLLHNHYDQTHAVYQSMITTSNGSFPYLAFINFSFPHVLKQSVKQFFTCSSYGAKNNFNH